MTSKRYLALIIPLLTALALPVVTAEGHVITSRVRASCESRTVAVSVSNWSGNVQVTRVHPLPQKVTLKPASGTATVVFTLSEIGGDGDYLVGRQGAPHDPEPVGFSVACATPQPTPSPTPTPSPSPTAGFSGTSQTLGAVTVKPKLPDTGHPAS